MEFRELTSSLLTFWGAGCAEHILDPGEYATFIRRRNHWINSNLPRGLSGIVGIDWGRIVSFAFELPIEITPLPVMGSDIAVVVCHWISPPMATYNHKNNLWERIIELVKLRGFGGIALLCTTDTEMPFFESLGFQKIAESDSFGISSLLLFLNLKHSKLPILKKPAFLPPPQKRKFVVDVFYPEYCPLGTILLNRVLRQISTLASQIEVRVHDTAQRDVVLRLGRIMGCYLNGENITSEIISGKSIVDIIENMKDTKK